MRKSSRPSFLLPLSTSTRLPVVLNDLSGPSFAPTQDLVNATKEINPYSLPGKFYQAQYIGDLAAAFKLSGESARVVFEGPVDSKAREQWDRFVNRLSSGELVSSFLRSFLIIHAGLIRKPSFCFPRDNPHLRSFHRRMLTLAGG
jgi:hypothetical protein